MSVNQTSQSEGKASKISAFSHSTADVQAE